MRPYPAARMGSAAARLDAGARHQHVEPPVVIHHPVHQARHGALISHVAGTALHGAARLGGQPRGGRTT
jgi:hypothetical protein